MDIPREAHKATVTGPKAASDVLHISVGVPYRDEAGMRAFVDSVSDPHSPNYRHFLTPEQVGQRFGISQADLKKVSDYLTSHGMKIRLVAKNRLSILADATVAQAQAAFNTTIQEYHSPGANRNDNGVRFSYTTTPSVPASIRPFVTLIGGLENFMRPHGHTLLTPSQLRTLYATAPIYDAKYQGQGRTIAISNWDGYLLSNVPLEYGQFGLPTPPGGVGSNITVISIDGQNGNGATAQGEGDVDIQCVLAMAPLCNLLIYDDANDNDLLGVITQEVEDNKADILTESYGWSAEGPTAYSQIHSLHLSMSAQGMTYLCASGDTGTGGVTTYPYPDQDPEVLVVGGTSVNADSNGNRLSEVVWNDGTNAGGGGWVADTTPPPPPPPPPLTRPLLICSLRTKRVMGFRPTFRIGLFPTLPLMPTRRRDITFSIRGFYCPESAGRAARVPLRLGLLPIVSRQLSQRGDFPPIPPVIVGLGVFKTCCIRITATLRCSLMSFRDPTGRCRMAPCRAREPVGIRHQGGGRLSLMAWSIVI